MSKKVILSKCITIITTLLLLTFAGGCAIPENTRVVLTTGFTENELFRIEDITCSESEFLVYLINAQDTYEKGFGSQIWENAAFDVNLENEVKKNCLSTLAQVKAMNLLAVENGIVLTDSERESAKNAGKEYFESLNDDEKKAMGNVSEATLIKLYEEYATADKLYEYIIRDINPEISDDEARTITVEQIVLNTWTLDSSGEKVPVSDQEKARKRNLAQQIISQLYDGTDFDVLIEQYNEADEGTVSFGKGEVDPIVEDAAFNLDNGETSGIVEATDAYVIMKCVSTFNREETEANKVRIVEERKREVFGEQYDAFTAKLSRVMNNELWEKIQITYSENVTTTSFFDVYDKYFPKEQ